ncbi:MAG: hypothetical protein AB1714_23705 [Acidobacteriota bacterium]
MMERSRSRHEVLEEVSRIGRGDHDTMRSEGRFEDLQQQMNPKG